MGKKIMSSILAIVLLFSFTLVASGDSSHLDPGQFVLKTAEDVTFVQKDAATLQDNTATQLAPITSRRLLHEKDKIQLEKEPEKVTGKIKQDIEDGIYAKDSVFPVRVVLDYEPADIGEQFEQKIKKIFLNTLDYKKVKFRQYDVNVTLDQLEALLQLEEVLFITDSSDEKPNSISTVAEPSSEENHIPDPDFTIMMNAASEMLGIKKARNDFGVTGDLDGNETSYTQNDVVLAIIDTGIDTSHVDLDGGKVIGWFDSVNGQTTPYDDNGHGTHVASIAAGTGDGDPGIQTGAAPGAALVGVKVLDSQGSGTNDDLVDGLRWIFNNRNTLNIDAVNMSLGTLSSQASVQNVIDEINNLNAAGIPVFVAAGNSGSGWDGNVFLGRYYNTLSTYAVHTDFSVGSVKDPYEGGWGLSLFSSRGTGSVGPYIVAPGDRIRAAQAGSTSGYVTWDGTSMATPIVAGTFALMYDAAFTAGGGTINFSVWDMGAQGHDKNYGNGNLLAYESIKNAGGLSGSFNTYRNYIVDQSGSVNQGQIVLYPIQANSSSAALNVTLLITDEGMQDLDLAIWEPGADPYAGAPSTFYINGQSDLPQEFFSIPTPNQGLYYIGVAGLADSANYTLEITGHEIYPQ